MCGTNPCNWAIIENGWKDNPLVNPARVLDDMARAKYSATDLGDLGFFPIEPAEVHSVFGEQQLYMMGAFVEVSLSAATLSPEDISTLDQVASIQAKFVAQQPAQFAPHIVLADNGDCEERQRNSGRIQEQHKMSEEEKARFAANVDFIQNHIKTKHGVEVYFHPHCGSRVETLDEIDWFVNNTSMQLVFDTGHLVYASAGAADLVALLRQYEYRIGTFHFKDIDVERMAASETNNWTYLEAVKNGLVVNLGKGTVDFGSITEWQRDSGYEGFVCVEQETYDPEPSGHNMLVNKQYLDTLYQALK